MKNYFSILKRSRSSFLLKIMTLCAMELYLFMVKFNLNNISDYFLDCKLQIIFKDLRTFYSI